MYFTPTYYTFPKKNTIYVNETTFLHALAPCMSALATQNLLKANKIHFFENDQLPGSSPDLDPSGNLGAILKQKVENNFQNSNKMFSEALHDELKKM